MIGWSLSSVSDHVNTKVFLKRQLHPHCRAFIASRFSVCSSEEKDRETESKEEKCKWNKRSSALWLFWSFSWCFLVVFDLRLAAASAAATSKNLWVSGLSSTTRATDLKTLFSKYGKVSLHISSFASITEILRIFNIGVPSCCPCLDCSLKVVGAKVVTNAKSPGARCYGFVTMSSTEEATKCISHLHRTELHGKMISVERVRTLYSCICFIFVL